MNSSRQLMHTNYTNLLESSVYSWPDVLGRPRARPPHSYPSSSHPSRLLDPGPGPGPGSNLITYAPIDTHSLEAAASVPPTEELVDELRETPHITPISITTPGRRRPAQ
eukprot:8937845-Pyramimonas_sp.AAC.1